MLDGFKEENSSQANYVSKRLDMVKTMRTAGIGLFMAVAVLPKVNEALAEAVKSQADWTHWGRVLLYVAVLLLIAAWIVSSFLEVNYLSQWATRIPYENVSPTFEAFMVVIVAVSLAVLLAFIENIRLFGFAYAFYTALDLIIWLFAVRKPVIAIFATSIDELDDEVRATHDQALRQRLRNQINCLRDMKDYYSNRFQEIRRISVLIGALALLPICILSAVPGASGWLVPAGYIGYAVLILIGEGVLLKQRIGLDRHIFEHESRRQKLMFEAADVTSEGEHS